MLYSNYAFPSKTQQEPAQNGFLLWLTARTRLLSLKRHTKDRNVHQYRSSEQANTQTNEQANKQINEQTNKQTSEQTNKWTSEEAIKRRNKRMGEQANNQTCKYFWCENTNH